MKNCTKHSIERWVERVVGIKNTQERDEYIRNNNDQIKEHMNKTFDFSEFIYKGQIGDNITRNYYIKNDIILCLNTQNDAVITVYKIDFGFTPEINLQVSKGLLKEVRELLEAKVGIDQEISEELQGKKHELEFLSVQEDILREQLKLVQDKQKLLEENIKNINSKSKIVELDIRRYVNHLVNSKEYKEDLKAM